MIQKMSRFLFLALFLSISTCHQIKQVQSSHTQILTGIVNTALTIPIPFHKCFKAQTQLQANNHLINFKPTRIGLSSLHHQSLKEQKSKQNILQELLSPTIYKHGHILAFDGYLLVFLAPNTIIVVQQSQNGFTIKTRYKLSQLDKNDKFKMYTLGQQGFLVTYNKQTTYLLGKSDYKQYKLPSPSTIVHLTSITNTQFFAAQFGQGLTHYNLNHQTKQIQIIKRIKQNQLGIKNGQFSYVVDVNINYYQEGIVLALDANSGLVEISIKGQNVTGSVVVQHKMCQSFDSVERSHIVLICQNLGQSTIIQVYRQLDRKNKKYHYRKLQPLFQANYLNDLHVTPSYYMVYSYKNIHIFWNPQKHRLPQSLQTQTQLLLPRLESFTFIRDGIHNYLYTVQAGEINKYQLKEENAVLEVRATQAISKKFKVFIYGSCQDIEQINKADKIQACRILKTIDLQITQQQYPRQQDMSISASIVGILIIVFLLVIWICIKKYRGLQKQARKVLKNYQNKRIRTTQSI